MNKKVFKLALQIVKSSKRQLPDKPSYRQICDEVGIGDYRSGKIHLSSYELRILENFLDEIFGKSVIDLSLEFDNRMDASKTVPDEKWAKGDVFKSMINMSSLASSIPLVGNEEISTPVGTVVSVRKGHLDVERIKQLIILENGETLVYWEEVIDRIPSEYKEAVMIYKGHGDNQSIVMEVINSLGNSAKVAIFFDYDAAGIDMALKVAEVRPIDLIVPTSLSPEILKLSKLKEFHKQQPQLLRRLKDPHTPEVVREHLMKMKLERLAITQEHLVVHKAQLKVIENLEIKR
ncbi:DUF7281 domain-containing protein [Vibrio splendidus]|uniref:DUF7281 domain-containing protein n=1 Tax=Vibrio splendidus TaxID=29497 RepID=UPI000D397650|nr:hypothetical protein [Vibrio splendidus]PTO62135.1 hypothetical protein CWN99_19270 [Vibrio splendidus]